MTLGMVSFTLYLLQWVNLDQSLGNILNEQDNFAIVEFMHMVVFILLMIYVVLMFLSSMFALYSFWRWSRWESSVTYVLGMRK